MPIHTRPSRGRSCGGTSAHSRRLNQHGIAHRYKEFPDNHTGIDYRMDENLPFLAQALSA